MKLKAISAGLLAAVLAACSGPSSDSNKRPSFFHVPVPPTPGAQIGYLSVHISGLNDSGTTTRTDVRISPGGSGKPKGNLTAVMRVDPQLTSRVALSLRNGRDSKAAFAFAQQMARVTYCPSGPITENSGIRKLNDPQDLQAILAKASGRDGMSFPPVSKAKQFPRLVSELTALQPGSCR